MPGFKSTALEMVPTRWIQTAAAVKCGRGEQKQHVLSVIIHHGRDSKGSACHKLGNNRFKVNKGLSFYLNSRMVQIIKCLFFEKNMGWVTSEASEGCTIIEVPLSKHFDRGKIQDSGNFLQSFFPLPCLLFFSLSLVETKHMASLHNTG